MSILANRIFYINSERRITGTSSNFSYTLDVPEANFDTVCVLSLTIPRSYYLVREGFNTFKLTIGGTVHTITVPPGNYGVTAFIALVLPLLNAFGAFTMKNNASQGKINYTSTAEVTFEFYSQLAGQFGFPEHSTTTFSGAFVSPIMVNFNSTSTLFIHSDMVDDSTSILQEVYSENSVPFSNIVYNCKFPGMYSKKLTKHGSKVFNFSLTDEHNDEVELNGHDICITLLMYKKENLTRTLQQIFEPGQLARR